MVWNACVTMLLLVGSVTVPAQTDRTGAVADTVKKMWPAGVISTGNSPGESSRGQGVLLDGMTAQWFATGDGSDFAYVRASVDRFVAADGSLKYPSAKAHSLDEIEMARSVLMLYRVTRAPKYYKAAKSLRDQWMTEPGTAGGGIPQRQSRSKQTRLGGGYMAEPFLAEYAETFQEPTVFDEVAKRLLLIDRDMRDLNTGLLRQGSDGSNADGGVTEQSLAPDSGARGNGLYAMALVDALDWVPVNDPRRGELLEALNKTTASALAFQDKSTGLWWHAMDRAGQTGNSPDASASCMFTYALAKGVRMGYLAPSYLDTAQKGWEGIEKVFATSDPGGGMPLTRMGDAAGLKGKTFSGEVIDNQAEEAGAFLMAGAEMAKRDTMLLGQGRTAAVDAWFNSQTRVNAAGETELFHYKWDDDSDSGFSFFGRAFGSYGIRLAEIKTAPTAAALKGVDVYVIASPDTLAKDPGAHVMDKASGDAIQAWVKAGGVLVLMANDAANTEFEHFNTLGDRFGIHFTAADRNKVEGNSYEQGEVMIPAGTGVFTKPHTTFMKEVCTIQVSGGATKVLTDKGDVLMAASALGDGMVFAVVDPWVYNEYTDGRKLPAKFDTYAAAVDLVGWLLKQTH